MLRSAVDREVDLETLLAFLNARSTNNIDGNNFSGVKTSIIHQAAEHIRDKGEKARVWDTPVREATKAALIFMC
ncbi:hypothetical protein K8R42_00015 [bacterium]|nr:hypothetical protein [bacterium]